MAVGVVTWSKTPASNDVADTSINWLEGQAPSSVNDSARGMMAAVAKWRDDIAGFVIGTTGSGTAYSLTTNQVFAANNNGNTVQFTPGLTNTGAVTLAVDGLTALPLRFLSGTDLPAGVLISGSLYQATLRVGEWLLHASPLAQPFLIPIGGIIDYSGTTAPNTNFVLPQGQAINRITYATYFSLVGTTYGTGDGSTTFNVPDMVGRVSAMLDAGSARLSSTYLGSSPATLGNSGGGQSQTLTLLQLPIGITTSGSNSISVTTTNGGIGDGMVVGSQPTTGGSQPTLFPGTARNQTSTGTNTITGTSTNTGANGNNTGAAAPHTIIQPTIILNKILRVI